MNQSQGNYEFPKSYLIKKIAKDRFKIRVDLNTRIAGVKEFIISRNDFLIIGLNYTILVSSYEDFYSILQSTKYQLLDEEYNPYKIRKILKYLEKNEDVVTSIIAYFSKGE